MSQGTRSSVDQIKNEVRQTIEELRGLTRAAIPFEQFCQTLLSKIVPLTGAHGAVIWQFRGEDGFVPTFDYGPRANTITIDPQEHQGLLHEVAKAQTSMCVASDAVCKGPAAANMLLIAVPIQDRLRRIWGVLELLQRSEINNETQQGYVKFITQIASLFARWQEQHDLRAASSSEEQWADRVTFVREIHKSIDLGETTYAIANEARRLLRADRVAVAVESGSGFKIKAVSSQDRFDNRGNVVKRLNQLITSSIRTATPLWLIGDTSNLPPKIAKQANEYLDEAHSRTFAVIPLMVQAGLAQEDLTRKKAKVGRKIGGLVIEFFDQEVSQANIDQNLSLITSESSVALENALATHDVFLLPLWRTLGKLREKLWYDYRGRTIAGAVALAALVGILCFWPASMKLKVDGVMQPRNRSNIFSKVDMAVVKTVHHDQSENVKAGELLLTMESETLSQKRLEISGQIDTLSEQITNLSRQLRQETTNARDEQSQLNRYQMSASVEQLKIEHDGLLQLRGLIDKQMESLKVYSPLDGTIMNWDAKRKLEGLPVQVSQPLLTVADLEGPWQVELLIPQNKCGYIREAFEKSPNGELPADFLLTTDPNVRLKGRLVKISDRAETNPKGLTEFRAIIEIDGSQLKNPSAGAGVIARVDCGRQPLGFVWFYQVYDFLRTRVFF